MDLHESVIITIHVRIRVRMVNDFRLRIKSRDVHFSSSAHYTAGLALIKKIYICGQTLMHSCQSLHGLFVSLCTYLNHAIKHSMLVKLGSAPLPEFFVFHLKIL